MRSLDIFEVETSVVGSLERKNAGGWDEGGRRSWGRRKTNRTVVVVCSYTLLEVGLTPELLLVIL